MPVPAPGSQLSLAQKKIKHVFVIIQENHTFDNYFGLYPGNGQAVENLGTTTAQAVDCQPDPWAGGCQRPFLITTNKAGNPNFYVPDAPDINGGGNSRFSQQFAIDGGKMDNFLAENEGASPGVTPTPFPATPSAAQVQAHNNALNMMVTYDCDTVPYLWYYAKNFVLFDHYFQANTGQSTPGNVELFAGQIGQTEVAAGNAPGGVSSVSGTGYTNGLPLGNDANPPPNNVPFEAPYNGATAANAISVASLPMLLNPAQDAAAVTAGITGLVPNDFNLEAKSGRQNFGWAWYQEGTIAGSGAPAAANSAHHNAPLYFDYINNAKSPFATTGNLKDNTYSGPGLIADLKAQALPSQGVFWIKGGAGASSFPFKPADAALTAAGSFQGTDDHPGAGSSDHQVAEAFLATEINAIAASPYWNDSVIIVTWDDSGGFYDHLTPTGYGSTCPDDTNGPFAGAPCGDGVRLPLLIISPFAKQGAVVHDQSDGGSIMKFIEEIFGLPAFGSLPDEAAGVKAGLFPADSNAAVSDLMNALDPAKLSGTTTAGAAAATVPAPAVPPAMSCASLGITPIASPTSVPSGFVTAGDYISHTPAGAARRLPPPPDDAD